MQPAIANAPPYLAPEILKAYGDAGLGLSGKGQEIAILIDTVPLDTDLTAFWAANGVPGSLSRITKINVKGGALPAPSGEETLDAEWASAIAPTQTCASTPAAHSPSSISTVRSTDLSLTRWRGRRCGSCRSALA